MEINDKKQDYILAAFYESCKKYKENLDDEHRKKWKEYYEENDKILKKYLDELKKEIELEEYNTIIHEWIVLILVSLPNLFIIIYGFYGYIQNNLSNFVY